MKRVRIWWRQRRSYTKVGMVLTVVWPLVVSAYLYFGSSETGVFELKPNEFGDFCAGLFAPLAFLWLVIGYAQQGEELAQNVKALNLQARETAQLAKQAKQQAQETAEMARHAKQQANILGQNEWHARRDLFYKTAEKIQEELRQSVIFLCLRLDEIHNDQWVSMKEEMSRAHRRGYLDAAAHYLADHLTLHVGQAHFEKLRMRAGFPEAVQYYIKNFEILLLSSDAVALKGDRSLRRFYEGTASGRLYEQLCLRLQMPSIIGQ